MQSLNLPENLPDMKKILKDAGMLTPEVEKILAKLPMDEVKKMYENALKQINGK